MTEPVHVVVPSDIDDPHRPSGGNVYDRRVCDGLAAIGWDASASTPSPALAVGPVATTGSAGRRPGGRSGRRDRAGRRPGRLGRRRGAGIAEAERLRLRRPAAHAARRGLAQGRPRERRGAPTAAAVVVTTSRLDPALAARPLRPGPTTGCTWRRPGCDPARLAARHDVAGAGCCASARSRPDKGHDVLVDALALALRPALVVHVSSGPSTSTRLRRPAADAGREPGLSRPGAPARPADRRGPRRGVRDGRPARARRRAPRPTGWCDRGARPRAFRWWPAVSAACPRRSAADPTARGPGSWSRRATPTHSGRRCGAGSRTPAYARRCGWPPATAARR